MIYKVVIPKEAMPAIRFLLSARHKKSSRYAIEFVRIKKSKKTTVLTATDGRKLHNVEMVNEIFKDVPDGLYDFTVGKSGWYLESQEGNFPKTDDVEPKKWNWKVNVTKEGSIGNDDISIAETILSILAKRGGRVSFNMLNDSMKYIKDCTVYFNEPDRPIKMTAEISKFNCSALIMPMSPQRIDFVKI